MVRSNLLSCRMVSLAVALGGLVGCGTESPLPTAPTPQFEVQKVETGSPEGALRSLLDGVNFQLAVRDAPYRLAMVEYLTRDADGVGGGIVVANDRGNKRLFAQFVPGDPRRGGRTDITFLVDQTEGAVDGLTTAATTAAIDRAMATWGSQQCSQLTITALPNIPGLDLGVVEFLSGLGGLPVQLADITHAGWLPAGLLPSDLIGATFTATFGTLNNPSDIDHDGYIDVAFREILYNDLFSWNVNGDVDVETVALHEAGHGLSQAHFGKIFVTPNLTKLQFSPLAVMNAAYSGVRQSLLGTDVSGHCGLWSSWPNR